MFLYIFVFFVSVQSSLGYDIEYTDGPLATFNKNTASNNGTSTAPDVQNKQVCDTAVTLQKILKVMTSMLRQDITENDKTSVILETLKDLLRNTAGNNKNNEMMYKINDLLHTLDTMHIEPRNGNDKQFLRGSLKDIIRQPSQLNEKISLKYELPTLKNSYCTEALINIIKIAHQAYKSLAKNPICNLPSLQELPSLPGPNPLIAEFIKPVTSVTPKPLNWANPIPKSTLPVLYSDYSINNPSNTHPNYEQIFDPEEGTESSSTDAPTPTQYEAIYEYLPNVNNVNLAHHPQFYKDYLLHYAPENKFSPNQFNALNYLTTQNHPTDNDLRPSFSPKNRPIHSPSFAQNQDAMPFEDTPLYPGVPFYPYNTNPEVNPKTHAPIFPWYSKKPGVPFGIKPQSNPFNPYLPYENYPYKIQKVPLPWEKSPKIPFYINSNSPHDNTEEIVYEIPIQVKRPEEIPSEIKPIINSPYDNPKIQKVPLPFPWGKSSQSPFYINAQKPRKKSKEIIYEIPINSQLNRPDELPLETNSNKQNVPLPLPWGKSPEVPVNSNGPHENTVEYVYEIPINSQIKRPDEFPSELNPVINSNTQKVPLLLPWEMSVETPFYIKANVPHQNANDIIYEFPIKRPAEIPSEINPAINSLHPNNPNYVFPQPLPSQTESLTLKYIPDWNYSPDTVPQAFKPNVFEFPYQSAPPQPNYLSPYLPVNTLIASKPSALNPEIINLSPKVIDEPNGLTPEFFPIDSQTLAHFIPNNHLPYSNNPNDEHPFDKNIYPVSNSNFPGIDQREIPKTEILEVFLNPNELNPNRPSYPFNPNDYNPVYKYQLKPTARPNVSPIYPNIPSDQIPDYELNWNPNGLYPNIPNSSPNNWTPNILSPETPQDLNPFLPGPFTAPNTQQVPDLKIIGFIRDAIEIIEGVIPVIKFDPPTLSIIAQIKDIIVQKDIETDDFATLLELYKKLINYVEQLKAYKEIIDIIDLPRVANRPKLENKKVVELTYLVKRPQPVLYYPYYYVKYRLPYTSFLVATKNLLRQKPHLRMKPKELYDELLALSKVAETSPDLKNYKKEDILNLTFKSGSLVDTKLVANDTLNDQLKILREITSDLTAEEILELNKEATNQIQQSVNNSETVNKTSKLNYLPYYMLKTNEHNDGKQKRKQDSPLISQNLLRVTSKEKPFIVYHSGLNKHPTIESKLDYKSFNSEKLRGDILRGDVGLPFSNSDYALQTNTKRNQEPSDPAMYKLFNATLEANKRTDKRGANPQNFVNSGGLVSIDNTKVSLNTGRDNSQSGITFYNKKRLVNNPSLSSHYSKTSGNSANPENLNTLINDQARYQELVNQHNTWKNQHNYFNAGGLVNIDNQKVSLNTGTGNRQDHVNFINPKELINGVTDFVDFDKTRTSEAPSNLNIKHEDTTLHNFKNDGSASTRFGVTNAGLLDETSEKSSDEAYNYFAKEDNTNFTSQNGINNFQNTNDVVEQTTNRQSLDIKPSDTSPNSAKSKDPEIANFIKDFAKEIRQYDDSNPGNNILYPGETNVQNENFNNYQNPIYDQSGQLTNSQDLSNPVHNAGYSNNQNTVVYSETPYQSQVNYDPTKMMYNSGNAQNVGYYGINPGFTDNLVGHQINGYFIQSRPIYYKRPGFKRVRMMTTPVCALCNSA